jgi:inorganic triphosphatase YgiF
MKKLSEQLLEMSQHVAASEERTETARAESRKDFQAHAAEARTRVKSFQQSFTERLDKTDEALAEPWRELDEAFAAQIARAQREEDARLNARDLARAKAQAEDAEAYAEMAAEFARLAAAEAESAMIEAKEARPRANSLENTPA